ncbi:hypothetical protein IP81_13650 [Novosphingobium sp. AAP83]|uniref:L,D-transpeptidase family protein n=1 Tax=Novosphingobium sp. AAP83 TaxID=1523425 RepID=UPI0006CD1E4F|nr:L,D-transpeptidase family protein [Novosphingobium sp. AAP83]KPF91205.1 hypothetical protein IP81_13650 [Novosphingobium sp. AAP83]
MKRWLGIGGAVAGMAALINLALFGAEQRAEAQALAVQSAPAVSDVLQSGVLIVVSKASQRMYVFKDGALWDSSPVSTGKRGHSTPAGVFPILQKRVHHRSNLYSNAPMPYMQRLTWRGVAIHAGRLPGYPASHGCIRLPYSFARALFALTNAASTTVVVTNEAVRTDDVAVTLALNAQRPRPVVPWVMPQPGVALAAAPVAVPVSGPYAGSGQTIQLAAEASVGEAEARWASLVTAYPELAGFRKAVIPAVVGQRQFYRLRASAPGAHAYCASLKRAGADCFSVS